MTQPSAQGEPTRMGPGGEEEPSQIFNYVRVIVATILISIIWEGVPYANEIALTTILIWAAIKTNM